jgi:hypothetical protein
MHGDYKDYYVYMVIIQPFKILLSLSPGYTHIICMYVCVCVYIYIYIYIYMPRGDKERNRRRALVDAVMNLSVEGKGI